MIIPAPSLILDTTLRDGEQAPGVALTPEEKAAYVRLAENSGIGYLEVGFPQNVYDRKACRAAADAAQNARLVGMALTTRESIDHVAEAGLHEVILVVPSSKEHIEYLYRRSIEHLLVTIEDAVQYAAGKGLAVNLGLEDAGHRDFGALESIISKLRDSYTLIDCITVPDTRGELLPDDVEHLLNWVRSGLRGFNGRLAFHAHNDLGLATANSLRALQLNPPVDCVHATVAGFGERAGNASLEQLTVLLETKLKRQTGIDLRMLNALAVFVQSAFLTMISAHAPILGYKTCMHESGLHQKALVENAHAYSSVDPATFGMMLTLVLGKHSGKVLRRQLAKRAGTSESAIIALQEETLQVDKTRILEKFEEITAFLRETAFVGLRDKDALARFHSLSCAKERGNQEC